MVETARGYPLARGARIRCPTLPLTLTALALMACFKPSDPLAKEIQSIIDRTVPAHGRMIPGDSPRRDGGALRASWKVEVDMHWDDYADWVATHLREFRLASRERDALRFSRPLAGDVYYVTLERRPRDGALLVKARFEAHPF